MPLLITVEVQTKPFSQWKASDNQDHSFVVVKTGMDGQGMYRATLSMQGGPTPAIDERPQFGDDLNLAGRLELLRFALEVIHDADEKFRACQADPSSTDVERREADLRLKASEREFGWQYKNVAELLMAYAKVTGIV